MRWHTRQLLRWVLRRLVTETGRVRLASKRSAPTRPPWRDGVDSVVCDVDTKVRLLSQQPPPRIRSQHSWSVGIYRWWKGRQVTGDTKIKNTEWVWLYLTHSKNSVIRKVTMNSKDGIGVSWVTWTCDNTSGKCPFRAPTKMALKIKGKKNAVSNRRSFQGPFNTDTFHSRPTVKRKITLNKAWC